MEYRTKIATCLNAVATILVAMVAFWPFRISHAADLHVVGTGFGIRSTIGPHAKNKEAGELLNCLLAPLGEDTSFEGHSRARINALRDTGQIDAIFPSGKFSSWTTHETLWVGPTHHIDLSWFKMGNDTDSVMFPAEIPTDAAIGVERNSYSEKWLLRQGYTNLIHHALVDELYASLIAGRIEYILTVSRRSSAYEGGIMDRADFAENIATKIPAGITFTKTFMESHPDFTDQLDGRFTQCKAAIDNGR